MEGENNKNWSRDQRNLEQKNQLKKIQKPQSWFFEKINAIDECLARLRTMTKHGKI